MHHRETPLILTQKYLKKVLRYYPGKGVFVRKAQTSPRIKVGDIAGSKHGNGYVHISVGAKQYFAHRLAWLYMTGAWPKGQIDHKNGVRSDNRWSNLRSVSKSENMQNLKRARSDNLSTGVLGVYPHGRKFVTSICLNGKRIYLGLYGSVEEARSAYLKAKLELHPGFVP